MQHDCPPYNLAVFFVIHRDMIDRYWVASKGPSARVFRNKPGGVLEISISQTLIYGTMTKVPPVFLIRLLPNKCFFF